MYLLCFLDYNHTPKTFVNISMARFSNTFSLISLVLVLVLISFGIVNFSLALLLGFAYALAIGNPFQVKTQWASGHLLKISIVLMGFGLNITEILETAKDSFWLTLLTISFAMLLGLLLGRLLQVDSRLSMLISGGTAICGGSAIAALAPAIQAKPTHILVAISVVFLLNAAGLIAYPFIGEWLKMDQATFGLWSALGIHDTSSVVGAAASYGEESLKIATTAKLARALWIIPLVFIAGFAFKHQSAKAKFPLFILFFIAASLITSYISIVSQISDSLVLIAKRGMAISLFLIGAGFSRETVKEVQINALWQGIILWIAVSFASFWLIQYFVNP